VREVEVPLVVPRVSLMDQVVGTLTDRGLDACFGMVGHSNLGMADALRRASDDGRFTYVGIRHEGAAAFAASGYAKLTGRPAACFSIAGPGATNLMTGLWDAKVDRVPVLALTGQLQTQVIGPGRSRSCRSITPSARSPSTPRRSCRRSTRPSWRRLR
jgi:pyruvate oxidase